MVKERRNIVVPSDGPSLPAPRTVAIGRDGAILVLDTAGRFLVYEPGGELRHEWRMPDSKVGKPEGVCELNDGRYVVADTHYHRLVFFDRTGQAVAFLGSLGKEPGQFIYPIKVTTDPAGNLYVAEYGGNDRVQKFSADLKFLVAMGKNGTENEGLQRASGVVWHDHKIFVSDAVNNAVKVFSDDGKFLKVLSTPELGLKLPYDLASGSTNSLYIIEYGAGRVTRVSFDGTLQGRYGTPGTGPGHFRTPWGIGVNPKGEVFVADTGNRQVIKLVFTK